jgi:transcriptional regulator with XRE-family HTH domain
MLDLEIVIGRVVATRRKRLSLTQEVLAEVTGLHPTYISLVERGLRCPSTRVLIALAEGLGTKPSNLMVSIERELAKAKPKPRTSGKKRPSRARRDGR